MNIRLLTLILLSIGSTTSAKAGYSALKMNCGFLRQEAIRIIKRLLVENPKAVAQIKAPFALARESQANYEKALENHQKLQQQLKLARAAAMNYIHIPSTTVSRGKLAEDARIGLEESQAMAERFEAGDAAEAARRIAVLRREDIIAGLFAQERRDVLAKFTEATQRR